MKQLNSLLFCAAAALLMLTSCMTSRYTSSDVKVSQIDELAFIEPRAYQLFFTTTTSERVKSLCEASEDLMEDLITSYRYPFSEKIPMDYADEDKDIARWIDGFSDLEVSDAKNLRVPKGLHNKIVESGHRYGIVVHSYGYIQSQELYDKERFDKLVEDIVRTLFNQTPRYATIEQYGNALYAAVIDTQTDRVVYYSRVLSNADHPLSRYCVSGQMKKLLKPFER